MEINLDKHFRYWHSFEFYFYSAFFAKSNAIFNSFKQNRLAKMSQQQKQQQQERLHKHECTKSKMTSTIRGKKYCLNAPMCVLHPFAIASISFNRKISLRNMKYKLMNKQPTECVTNPVQTGKSVRFTNTLNWLHWTLIILSLYWQYVGKC